MRIDRPGVSPPHAVGIIRECDWALIKFAEASIASTRLALGCRMRGMTDEDLRKAYKDRGRTQDCSRATHEHIDSETPGGTRQVERDASTSTGRPDAMTCAESSRTMTRCPVIPDHEQELA